MYGRKRRLKTLGRYPNLSLAEARREAKRVQADANAAHLPTRPEISFGDARERFLRDCQARNKPSTAAGYKRLLHRHFDHQQDISALSRADIMGRIEKLAPTPGEQQHAFVAIRTMMNWCVKRGLLETSPVPPLTFKTASRSHVLSDNDLRTVWDRAVQYGYPYGSIKQLLILTGQRKSEIAQLRRSWIEDDLIVFPAGFTKNRREHRVPLGDTAQSMIAAMPETADLLFPSRSDDEKPFNGWSKCKRRFDAPLAVEPYTLHDLRRTFSSNLARLGAPIHVTEKLLNHVSGTISGVAAIYNRHSYLEEMREAVRLHEAHLAELIAD